MRIAVVAPPVEPVPPPLYGGTERVVSNLTEELVRRGHDVTLFASGDSLTSARLVPCVPRALRLDPSPPAPPPPPPPPSSLAPPAPCASPPLPPPSGARRFSRSAMSTSASTSS